MKRVLVKRATAEFPGWHPGLDEHVGKELTVAWTSPGAGFVTVEEIRFCLAEAWLVTPEEYGAVKTWYTGGFAQPRIMEMGEG
jgi:hypothetical protein